MKSDIKNVAAFLAVAIWADGVYAEEEKMILAEIAEVLNVEESELTENVDEALKVLQDKDDEAVQAYIIENASALDEEDVKVLMQCAIEIVKFVHTSCSVSIKSCLSSFIIWYNESTIFKYSFSLILNFLGTSYTFTGFFFNNPFGR